MEALLILVIVAALLALGYAAFNFIGVKKLDEGTDRMKEISAAIRVGANAFITYEYKIIAVDRKSTRLNSSHPSSSRMPSSA